MSHLGKVEARLVLVEWMDSRRPDGAWRHLGGAQDWRAVKCVSVGWMVADDAEKKVLAPNMGDIDDASNMQLSGEIVIPTPCVLRIKPLSETSSMRKASASKPRRRHS